MKGERKKNEFFSDTFRPTDSFIHSSSIHCVALARGVRANIIVQLMVVFCIQFFFVLHAMVFGFRVGGVSRS